jgi:hypothetical protein
VPVSATISTSCEKTTMKKPKTAFKIVPGFSAIFKTD